MFLSDRASDSSTRLIYKPRKETSSLERTNYTITADNTKIIQEMQ